VRAADAKRADMVHVFAGGPATRGETEPTERFFAEDDDADRFPGVVVSAVTRGPAPRLALHPMDVTQAITVERPPRTAGPSARAPRAYRHDPSGGRTTQAGAAADLVRVGRGREEGGVAEEAVEEAEIVGETAEERGGCGEVVDDPAEVDGGRAPGREDPRGGVEDRGAGVEGVGIVVVAMIRYPTRPGVGDGRHSHARQSPGATSRRPVSPQRTHVNCSAVWTRASVSSISVEVRSHRSAVHRATVWNVNAWATPREGRAPR
jgi:hypothetical protein